MRASQCADSQSLPYSAFPACGCDDRFRLCRPRRPSHGLGGPRLSWRLACRACSRSSYPSLRRERLQPGPGNRDRLTRPFTGDPRPRPLDPDRHARPAVSMVADSAVDSDRRTDRLRPGHGRRALGHECQSVLFVRGAHSGGPRTAPITAGPYRFVRHPGYTASVLGMIAGGLSLRIVDRHATRRGHRGRCSSAALW